MPFHLQFRKMDLEKIYSGNLWKSVKMDESVIAGHFVVDVSLTEEMLICALCIGARTNQSAIEKNLPQMIKGLGGSENDIIGAYGTFAASAYLYKNWLKALDFLVIGKADGGDLKIDSHTLDIKTRSKPSHDLLMIPKGQWIKKKYDFYVGCSIIKEGPEWIVRVWGFTTKEELEEKGEWDNFGHGATLTMPFKELHDIRELGGLEMGALAHFTKVQFRHSWRRRVSSMQRENKASVVFRILP